MILLASMREMMNNVCNRDVESGVKFVQYCLHNQILVFAHFPPANKIKWESVGQKYFVSFGHC